MNIGYQIKLPIRLETVFTIASPAFEYLFMTMQVKIEYFLIL